MSRRIVVGHVLEALKGLPDASVQACVTSPPYFGLREYGTEPLVWGGEASHSHAWGPEGKIHKGGVNRDKSALADRKVHVGQDAARDINSGAFCACGAWRGSLGQEPTPQLYVSHLVEVFREVRRVLRDDGTLWLNLGDSYCSSPKGNKPGEFSTSSLTNPDRQDYCADRRDKSKIPGFKAKDLLGIPWRVAFGLQDAGWYLRSDIVWEKPNPMPESVTDRPTRSHEYLFLLSKSERYFFDSEAIKEAAAYAADSRAGRGKITYAKRRDGEGEGKPNGQESFCHIVETRNKRSVWRISTRPCPWEFCGACGALFEGAERKGIRQDERGPGGRIQRLCPRCGAADGFVDHFAAFPEALVEPCVLAGTSERGRCRRCLTPFARVVERQKMVVRPGPRAGEYGSNTTDGLTGTMVEPPRSRTAGWSAQCRCGSESEPCSVLDPFCGSGTVGVVAARLGRSFVGVELNPSYARVADARVERAASAAKPS